MRYGRRLSQGIQYLGQEELLVKKYQTGVNKYQNLVKKYQDGQGPGYTVASRLLRWF